MIRVERSGAIRTVVLARPEKRNALNSGMIESLMGVFSTAPDEGERVVVLRAEGPVFCAGLDLRERLTNPTPADEGPIEKMLHAMEHYPLPLVAVVQGDAIAGGCELALHCDFIVVSSAARFGMSLAQIGIAPSWFLAKKLVEVAGPLAARELLLLGDPVSAARMHELNLISRIAAPQDLESSASAIIDRLAANAPLSLRAIKALLVRQMEFRDGIGHEDIDALVDTVRASKDAEEGTRARIEKRRPRFTGT